MNQYFKRQVFQAGKWAKPRQLACLFSVSYTHLTLPTKA